MAAKNKLHDLRDHLFETLEALKDEEKPMEIERTKAICAVAEQLIDTARVEVSFLQVTGNMPAPGSFLDSAKELPPGPGNGNGNGKLLSGDRGKRVA